MLKYNLSEAKAKFSAVMDAVEAGEYVTLCKRNKPVAMVVPCETSSASIKHKTRIGWAKDNLRILGNIENPVIPASDWEILQ